MQAAQRAYTAKTFEVTHPKTGEIINPFEARQSEYHRLMKDVGELVAVAKAGRGKDASPAAQQALNKILNSSSKTARMQTSLDKTIEFFKARGNSSIADIHREILINENVLQMSNSLPIKGKMGLIQKPIAAATRGAIQGASSVKQGFSNLGEAVTQDVTSSPTVNAAAKKTLEFATKRAAFLKEAALKNQTFHLLRDPELVSKLFQLEGTVPSMTESLKQQLLGHAQQSTQPNLYQIQDPKAKGQKR
jgi:hypothetical protein